MSLGIGDAFAFKEFDTTDMLPSHHSYKLSVKEIMWKALVFLIYKALVFLISTIGYKPNVCKKHGYILICGEPPLISLANGLNVKMII